MFVVKGVDDRPRSSSRCSRHCCRAGSRPCSVDTPSPNARVVDRFHSATRCSPRGVAAGSDRTLGEESATQFGESAAHRSVWCGFDRPPVSRHGAWCRMAAVLVSVAGFIVGFIVGLTGMGGGALMTPIMVLVFGVQPLAAVSSDLMASLVMKPVGAGVHMRHGAVNRRLVLFLCIGSVPAAFSGVLLLNALDTGEQFQNRLKIDARPRPPPGRRLDDRQERRRPAPGPHDDHPGRSDPGPARPHHRHRSLRRPDGRPDLGRLGLADHRPAAAALPDAVGQGPRRHRPRPGHPARRGRHPRPPPVRRLPARPDR